jgi:uncharacterized metal-binding protein YceD (DUF177 family)
VLRPGADWDEAPEHLHNREREAFVTLQGVVQLAAPCSRTLRPRRNPNEGLPSMPH